VIIDPRKKEMPEAETERIDPRKVALLMAVLRFHLVEAGEWTLDEAFSGAFIELLRKILAPCTCEARILDAWERGDIEIR
jgi:hypothetical protein